MLLNKKKYNSKHFINHGIKSGVLDSSIFCEMDTTLACQDRLIPEQVKFSGIQGETFYLFIMSSNGVMHEDNVHIIYASYHINPTYKKY